MNSIKCQFVKCIFFVSSIHIQYSTIKNLYNVDIVQNFNLENTTFFTLNYPVP